MGAFKPIHKGLDPSVPYGLHLISLRSVFQLRPAALMLLSERSVPVLPVSISAPDRECLQGQNPRPGPVSLIQEAASDFEDA